jgi:RNA polymerase sigma-70 factor (ECF subfamily)
MDPLTDDDLMRLYGEGDVEAFDTLFDRHYLAVCNFAHAMLGDSGEAEEVLQETFLAVAQAGKTYNPHGVFRAWLMRIVRNRCLNRLDARRARDALLQAGGWQANEPRSADPTPAARVERRERGEVIRSAVAALPDRQREAIAMYAFQQMSYQEIAMVMEIPLNTVKTLIHRARAELARRLAPYLEGDET